MPGVAPASVDHDELADQLVTALFPTSPGRRHDVEARIRRNAQLLKQVVARYCRRHLREDLHPNRFEVLLALTTEEIAKQMRAVDGGARQPPAIHGNALVRSRVEDARRSLRRAEGRYTRPERLFSEHHNSMPAWWERLAPDPDERQALGRVYFYAAGYGPTVNSWLPYQSIERNHGVLPTAINAALARIATQRPAFFDANFGSGLMTRAQFAPPSDLAHETTTALDTDVAEALFEIERVREGAMAELQLLLVEGLPVTEALHRVIGVENPTWLDLETFELRFWVGWPAPTR